jgi:hypothetical protein
MKKILPTAKDFEYPGWAEFHLTKQPAIKKARFILSDGGSVEIGIFSEPPDMPTLGAILCRDKEGKAVSGTVCKTKEPSGLDWYQAMQQGLLGKSLN